MRLSILEIENFRGLENLRIDFLPTTLLIGENNSGKTSVLEAIRLALSRSAGRRTGTFEPYDYYLADSKAEPQGSDPIKLTLTFTSSDGEVLPEEFVQTLGDALVTDAAGKSFLILRVTSKFDVTLNDFVSEWRFLDVAGNPLGPKSRRPALFQDFQRLFPVFYLSALRDAVREFRTGSYWAPFIKNPSIEADLKSELQARINQLNAAVLDAHASLKTVKEHLVKIRELVPLGVVDTVDIDALPARISDLLTSTQVNVCAITGASLPLVRHGAGTQSLSVLFLFQAYLTAMLEQHYSNLSAPILALEEPEAHLHPFATRSLWATIDAVPGQKVVASHSGELLAAAPLKCVRRLYSANGSVHVGSLTDGLLTAEEERKIQFHITASRGELLFARCWLLIEGESEHWIFEGLARTQGRDLDKRGVRMLAYSHSGHECVLKVANALGIPWFLVADGDQSGNQAITAATAHLNGANAQDRLLQLAEENLELHLCANGFGPVFVSHISPQKANLVVATAGTPDYWKQVLKARDDAPKPAVIREAVDRIEQGAIQAPPLLMRVLDRALHLAGA